MSYHSFLTPPKEFNKVIKAILPGLIHLVKCHSLFNPRSSVVTRSTLLLKGVDLLDKKSNNRHVRQIFQFKKKMYPRGKFYWRSLVDDIDWCKTGARISGPPLERIKGPAGESTKTVSCICNSNIQDTWAPPREDKRPSR